METANRPGQSMALAHRLSQVMRRHPLFFFYLMAYAFSWLTWLPLILSQDGLRLFTWPLPSWETTFVGTLLGPMLSAFIMTGITEGKPGIDRLLSRFILWRVQLRWYLVVLLGIPALLLLSIVVLPGAIAAFRAPAPTFVLVYLVSYVVIFILGGPLGMEPGFRGFALPRWQQRSGPLVGTLISGVLWGLWLFPPLPVTRIQCGRNGLRRHQHSLRRVPHRYNGTGGHLHLGLQQYTWQSAPGNVASRILQYSIQRVLVDALSIPSGTLTRVPEVSPGFSELVYRPGRGGAAHHPRHPRAPLVPALPS